MEEFRIVLADACKIVKESSRKHVISGADEDGRVMVEFSEPVGGRRVKMLTPDEINGMLYKEETSESPANAEEAMAEETEPPTAGQEENGESALERIPKDAQTGEPQYTQTDAGTAWDAIVEQTEGDKDMARYVAESTMKAKEEALKKLESSEPKAGATVTETIAAAKEHKAAIAAARQELGQWKAIAEVENSRKAEAEAKAEEETGVKLSDEIDENGRQFVLTSNGDLAFGEIGKNTGLTEAPILLSEGVITNTSTNDGYGLAHIEARHGEQIRKAGYKSVIDFIEKVAKNYDVIKKGSLRDGRQTYRLQLTDKHNNTLMVELSDDGTYWNINTAGIFKTSYGKKNEEVYNRHTTVKQSVETVETSQDTEQSDTQVSPSMNVPTTSTGKVSESPETKQEKAEKSISAKVKEASADVNTEPTEAQKEAGNYKKGHVQVGTFDITIEQPEGSIRRGTDANGKQWESKMHNTYGYFRGTEGVDGDHIDVFLSNDMDDWNGAQVFVVDQYNPDGTFDEHKVMLGFNDASDAKNNYLANYEKDWEKGRRIDVSAVSLADFEKWIASSHRKTKPFSEYKSVKPADDSETFKGHKVENSGKEALEDVIGRSLNADETHRLIAFMENTAESAPELELTPQNWTKEFGESGVVSTPIGEVKQGDNQYLKLAQQGRNGKLGMIKPTLEHPSVIIEDERASRDGNTERGTSYVFIKTFVKKDGSRYYHFASITVSKEGKEVVISSQERSTNRISKLLQQGKVTWIDREFSLHPTAQIEKSVPLNDSNKPTSTDSQPALLGINSSELNASEGAQKRTTSTGKVSESPETKQEKKEKSEESKSKEENRVDDAKIDAVLEALSKGDEKAEQLVQGLTSRELSKLRSKVKASPVLENEWLHRVRTRGDVSLHDWMLENQYVEPVKRVSGTFKMTDYIAPKDSPYAERIGGVYHDKSGFAVATDGRILVADKGSYDPKLKGKIIGKDGAAMENKFPDWQEAIRPAKETKSSNIDVEDLHRFVAGVLKADKHAYISLRFPDGTVVSFDADKLNLMLRAMKRLGADKLLYMDFFRDGIRLVAKSDKGAALLMGRVSAEDESMEEYGYAYDKYRKADLEREKANNAPETNKTGAFGTIYTQFKGKAKEAIAFLLEKKEGEAVGALHHKDIGDIDLVWGNEKAGLQKIAKKHPEVLDNLQEIIGGMHVVSESPNRIKLESTTHFAVVSKEFLGKERGKWLLTAYEKKKDASGGSIDIAPEPKTGKQNGTAPLQDTVSMGKVSESPETKQEKDEKSEEDRQNKISDVGEKISGARKDLLRDFSNKLKETTLESLITLPFSKAFKRPDLKTAVEHGLLRQRDARFAEAVMATYLSKNKPRLLSGWKKGVSQKNLEAWAKDAYFGVQTLRALFEADETTRDKLIDEILSAKAYREDDIDRRKKQLEEWNPGKKFEGKCYPLNPVAVYMAVYERLGYDNIGEFKLPVSGVGSSTFFDHYELTDNSGKKIYPTRALQSFEDVVDEITYLSKVKNADEDTDHPNSIFRLAGINPVWESTGWRVLTLGTSSSKRPETHLFKTKEEAEKFAEEYKAGGKSRQASTPIENKELIGYGNYELKFHLGEKDISTGLTFSSKEDARAAIDTEHEKLNAIVNEKLAKARESGGKNEKRPQKDYVRIQAYTEDGKTWKYAVVLDERYAPKSTAFNTLPYSLANGFSTRKEAVVYIEKHRAEWDAKIDDINRRRKDFVFLNGSSERVGEDYRKGEDITAEQFREQFGFRGVQFGNWTNQKDRQAALNNAFDSFMDLAKILGISPKAVSLNGELGIAFGARGGGGAKAHYEREEVVINLTKTMGAGSLAHEWWHALDNYFARRGNVKLGMVTEGKGIAMRGELRKAYDKLVSDTENSDYNRRSRDAGASYWGTRREETARMFAMWVFDEISKKGERNSFLTDNDPAAEERYAKGNYDFYVLMCGQDRPPMTFEEFRKSPSALAGYVYPSQQELEEFGADLRKIFDTVQERVDEETGNTVLYHRGEVVSEMSPGERVLRDAVIDRLRESGMEVITDEEAGQRVLDEANGKAKLSAKKRRALETASLGKTPRSLTVVSSADGANVLKSIDTLVSEFEKSAVQPKTFIGDVAKALGAKRGGSASEYASFETKNGKIITIRLSNHNAKVSNFDANGETDGISIVVSPKKSEGMTNDGKAHVVEYYYDAIKLRRAEGKPLADIVRSIKQALYSGEFEDTTGLAERQEVNAEITDRVRFFRTAKGEAYGFTVGGKIYVDPKIANTETPIHEYAHLWAAALRGQNPKEWQNIVELMKGTSVWDEVKKRYSELNTDDDIADEVLATYSGRRGAERLREEQRKIAGDKGGVFEKAEAISALERVKQALRKFWKSVADFLHIHYKSAEEVADRVMKDLLDGVDPGKHFSSRMDESKTERIEKLRESKPVEITGDEITPSDDLKQYKRNALEYGKKLRGVYTNEDTGEQIELTGGNRRGGLREILQHDYKDKEHLQSIAAIPQIIEKAIFIDELPNEDRKNYPGVRAFRYYVCGLKIADVDYTVKAVIAEQNNGERYYDHKLTKIEKGKLLSIIPTIQKAGMDSDLPRSVGKDSRLLSILQVKDEKKPNRELYRAGSKELRDGRKIEFVRKPTATYNALARHLQAEGIKPDMHEARTGSRYMSFEKDGVQWEVRSSDHTKPEYYGEAQKPVELTYYKDKQGEENLSVSVDLGTSGYNIEDMKALMAEIDRLKNDAGEVKESFYRGVASDEVMERYPLLSQALGVKSENEVRAKEEAREHAEEARKQEMRSAVEDMAGRLHLNNVDIVDKPAERGAGRRERAKGMFERSTGRITINIGNCAAKRDAVVTLLHEAVAHHGLRKLFGENFETFLDNVYNSANAEIRRIIDKHSRRYGGDKRTATEEYMASLSERTDFENAKKSGWWQRIKDFFLKMLEKIGLKGFKGEDLSDNELRYVLWRSYENLKSGGKDTVFSAADDLAKQSELKVGEFAPDAKKTAPEENAEEVNERFNNELTRYQSGDMDKNEMLHLGKPQGVMKQFLPDLPIVVRQRILKKGSEKKHNIDVAALANMPRHLSSPIFVFQRSDNALGVLTEMQDRDGKNVCVAIELGREIQNGGEMLEVNDIRSVHGRNVADIVYPIVQNGTLKWADKEKGLAYLSSASRYVQQEIDRPDLSTAAKVVKDFVNPKSESKNDILFRDGDAKDYEKAQARETYERRVSTGMFQSREAIQDSMLSLKVAMDAIEEATAGKAKRIEDYDGFENAYLGENRLSSVNQAESAAFAHLLIRPMMEEVNRLAPTAEDRAELIDYMFAKHGLERNAYMRQQAAEKKLAEYKKQNPGTAKTVADFIDAERDYAGLTTLTGKADVSAAEAEAQRMAADYENDYTFHGTWNEIYVCRKKIC